MPSIRVIAPVLFCGFLRSEFTNATQQNKRVPDGQLNAASEFRNDKDIDRIKAIVIYVAPSSNQQVLSDAGSCRIMSGHA